MSNHIFDIVFGVIIGLMVTIVVQALWPVDPHEDYDKCRNEFVSTTDCFDQISADSCLKLIEKKCGVDE